MNRPVLVFACTLALNAVLLAIYFQRHLFSLPGHTTSPALKANPITGTKFSVSVAQSPGNDSTVGADNVWSSFASPDLRVFAARLRAAGVPPSIIRAVISVEIAKKLEPQLVKLAASLEAKPFWTPEGEFRRPLDAKTRAAFQDYTKESNRLLREALGEDLLAQLPVSDFSQRNYGNLSAAQIERLQQTTTDYNDLRVDQWTAARGIFLPEDREKLIRIETEKRDDLARLLSPHELEEYDVRSSITTTRLRTVLTAMDATEEEFRAIYKAESAYDRTYRSETTQIPLATTSIEDRRAGEEERAAALAQVAAELKAALGEQRFAEYNRSTEFEFQKISRVVREASLPATAAVQVYDLRQSAGDESSRIFDNPTLSVDQKRAALQTLAQTTRAQITSTLGSEAGRNYLEIAESWIARIESGSAVTFHGNGMRARGLPKNQPPGAAEPGARSSPPVPTSR